MKVSIKRFLIM